MPSWGPDLVKKLILFYSILFYSICKTIVGRNMMQCTADVGIILIRLSKHVLKRICVHGYLQPY
jgi:hypothetical protein